MLAVLVAQASVAGTQLPPLVKATGEPTTRSSIANWTVPVGGVVPLAGVTCAEKLTDAPYVTGFDEEVTVVVVEVAGALKTAATNWLSVEAPRVHVVLEPVHVEGDPKTVIH
jgi:hypothetical protein